MKTSDSLSDFRIAGMLEDEAFDLMERGNAHRALCLPERARMVHPKIWNASHNWKNVSRASHAMRGANTYRCTRCGQSDFIDSAD